MGYLDTFRTICFRYGDSSHWLWLISTILFSFCFKGSSCFNKCDFSWSTVIPSTPGAPPFDFTFLYAAHMFYEMQFCQLIRYHPVSSFPCFHPYTLLFTLSLPAYPSISSRLLVYTATFSVFPRDESTSLFLSRFKIVQPFAPNGELLWLLLTSLDSSNYH